MKNSVMKNSVMKNSVMIGILESMWYTKCNLWKVIGMYLNNWKEVKL